LHPTPTEIVEILPKKKVNSPPCRAGRPGIVRAPVLMVDELPPSTSITTASQFEKVLVSHHSPHKSTTQFAPALVFSKHCMKAQMLINQFLLSSYLTKKLALVVIEKQQNDTT
jgi:hypothetical protein